MTNNNKSILVTSVHPRYIHLDEDIFDNLSPNAYRVYTALRFYSDFKLNESQVKLTIKSLIEKSKIGKSSVHKALNELETKHFLIQRTNYIHFKYGKINSYNVSRTYNFFKQQDESFSRSSPNGLLVKNLPNVRQTDEVVRQTDTYRSLISSDNIYLERKESFDQINHTAKNGVADTTPPKMAERLKNEKPTPRADRQPLPQNEDTAPCPQKPDAVFSDTYKTKKDLQIKEFKKNTFMFKNSSMQLSDIMDCNPFEITEAMLSDWLDVRKSKKAIVTATAWDRLNKELQKCQDLGISPHEAFETMVTNGWNSLNADWIKIKKKSSEPKSQPTYDHISTEWIKNVYKDMF